MKVTDERLDELADGSQNVAYFEVVSIAKELRSYRKGIKQAVEEIRNQIGANVDYVYDADDYIKGFYEGTKSALESIEKHIQKEE